MDAEPPRYEELQSISYDREGLLGKFLALCVINFPCALDQTVLAVVLPVSVELIRYHWSMR